MKAHIFILVLIVLLNISFGQTTYTKYSYSSLSCRAISKTVNNGFIIGADITSGRCYIARFDSLCDVVWEKEIGNQYSYIKEIVMISDSNYLVCLVDSDKVILVNFNDVGDTLNTNSIAFNGIPDILSGIKTLDGGAVFCGSLGNSFPQGNMLVIKVDPTGNLEWCKTFPYGYEAASTSITQSPDSNYFMTGFIKDSVFLHTKGSLVKLSTMGDIIWSKTYQYNLNYDYSLLKVLQWQDSLFLIGQEYPTVGMHLIRTDTSGNIDFSKTYFQNPSAYSEMQLLPDENLIISSMTELFSTNPGYLMKTDRNGNLLWNKYTLVGNKLLPLENGAILLVGNHYDNLVYEMGIMIGDSLGFGVSCWTAGFYPPPVAITLVEDTLTLSNTNAGITTLTLIPLDPTAFNYMTGCLYVGISAIENQSTLEIFPNPNNGEFLLSIKNSSAAVVKIFDLYGRQLFFQRTNKNITQINVSKIFPKGVYFVSVYNGMKNSVSRIVIN